MKVVIKEQAEDLVIELSGREASAESVEEFRRILDEGIARPGGGRVILNLSSLNYLGREGVYAIALAHKQLNACGRLLILRHPTEAVERVLKVTRLSQFLKIENDDS